MKMLPRAIASAIAAAFGLASERAVAQQEAPAVRVEKIEITGSNIRRLEAEGALPVTTITRAEIERSGATTAAELLDKVTAVNAGGYNVSLAVGDSFRPGLSAVSLRGLGSNSTLVLLNGRRLSNYAFNGIGGGTVNLNQIPIAAVERIEVLKDGASAIYGTDAIGGVINFILRKDYEGAEVTAYGTRTDGGGGNTVKYTGAIGFGDIGKAGFNVLAVVDYQRDTALRAAQRQFASTAIRPDLGFALTSGQVFPANFRRGRGPLYNVTAAQGCIPATGSRQINQFTGEPAPTQAFCRYDFTSVLEIYPPAERKGFFTRGALQLGADHQAFVEYHLGRNEVRFAASETPVADFVGTGPYLYPAGGPFYPATVTLPDGTVIRPTGDLTIFWRLKQGGLRTNRADSDESRLVAGLQGVIVGWDYNTAFSRSQSNAVDNYLDGYVRESVLKPAIASGLIDVFSGAPQSAAGQSLIDAAKILGKIRESDARVTAVDARLSRDLFQLRNGPLAIALGFEHRKEELEERPEEVLFSGDILGRIGALPPTTRAGRTTTAMFAELNIPLLRDLEAQVAVRNDQYSDFGRSTNPKIALRWTPTKALLARASYGTGFRAPTLSDLFLPLAGAFTGLRNDPLRCPNGVAIGAFVDDVLECTDQFPNRYGGNPNLQPEKSRQWTLGLAFEPSAGSSIGIDYWSIRRRNTIVFLDEDVLFNVYGAADPLSAGGRFVRRARLPGGGCDGDGEVPTPAGIPCAIDYVLDLLENAGKYAVSGIDLSAGHRFALATLGTISVRVEGTYFLRFRFQTQYEGPYFDNVGRADINGAVTRWRHYVTLNWRRGAWGATVAHNFVLGYRDEALEDLEPRRVASHETWDLQGTWDAMKALTVTLGVRNLFDRDPPASRQGNTFQVGYDARYFDPRGRTWYLGLKYAFK